MKPKHRNSRLLKVGIGALVTIAGMFLLLKALGNYKELFKNPSDVVNIAFVQGEQSIRVGGMIVDGSIVKSEGLITTFSVIDFMDAPENVPALNIRYDKVLPDLFREGEGVVVTGKLNADGLFVASKVLAKHDENYMPKMPEKDY